MQAIGRIVEKDKDESIRENMVVTPVRNKQKRNPNHTLCHMTRVPSPKMLVTKYNASIKGDCWKDRGERPKTGYHFEFKNCDYCCNTCNLYFTTLSLYHEHVMLR